MTGVGVGGIVLHMSTDTYTYPEGFVTGQIVGDPFGNATGIVTFPGGGNGTAPGFIAVDYGTVNGRYIGTLKVRATDLELVNQ